MRAGPWSSERLDARSDAACLRTAATILLERSRRPSGVMMRVLCRVLHGQADAIMREFDDRERSRRNWWAQ